MKLALFSRRLMLPTACLLLSCATAWGQTAASRAAANEPQAISAPPSGHGLLGYTPVRVYDTRTKKFSDFEAMTAELTRAEIVFVGEQHDDPATHRLELALLSGLARRKRQVTVALEMFERDVQAQLNDYLAGKLTEAEFLKSSRPWPRYATDYRGLIEFARAHQLRVIASNVPRKYASQVSRGGLNALDTLPAAERAFVAAEKQCPFDDYFKRFGEAMSAHPGDVSKDAKSDKPKDKAAEAEAEKKQAEQRAMVERFYYAQCVKDETMAESIVQAHQAASEQPKPLIVHYNGAFHSDYGYGTAARVKRRLPKAALKVITIIPLSDLDAINTNEYRKRGDYIVFTYQAPKPAPAPTK